MGPVHGQVTHHLWRPEAQRGTMCIMPTPYPQEFRDDIVRVAKNRVPGK